jgi:uncharacterized membrane protein YfhO
MDGWLDGFVVLPLTPFGYKAYFDNKKLFTFPQNI